MREKESAGKKHGTSGAKMGNFHLKWAFSEAAVLFVRHSPEGKKLLAKLEKRFGKGKALGARARSGPKPLPRRWSMLALAPLP